MNLKCVFNFNIMQKNFVKKYIRQLLIFDEFKFIYIEKKDIIKIMGLIDNLVKNSKAKSKSWKGDKIDFNCS